MTKQKDILKSFSKICTEPAFPCKDKVEYCTSNQQY